MHLVRVHYFVCGLRFMFSSNLRILLIRQCKKVRSLAYHIAVAVATGVTALDGVWR